MIAASITAKDPSNWYSTLTINKGEGDGLKPGQPVGKIDRELVGGEDLRVGNNWAEVITILDTRSSVEQW